VQLRCVGARCTRHPLGDGGETPGQRRRVTHARHRPVVAQVFGDLLHAMARQTVERLHEEHDLHDARDDEPLRIPTDEVGDLMREHTVLLVRLELVQRATRQTDLVAGKRDRTRQRRRRRELDRAVHPRAVQQRPQPRPYRGPIQRRAFAECAERTRVSDREPEQPRARGRQPEHGESGRPSRSTRPCYQKTRRPALIPHRNAHRRHGRARPRRESKLSAERFSRDRHLDRRGHEPTDQRTLP